MQPQPSNLIRNPRFLQILIVVIFALVAFCLCLFLYTQFAPVQNWVRSIASAPTPTTVVVQPPTPMDMAYTVPPGASPAPTTAIPSVLVPPPAVPSLTPTATATGTPTRTPTSTRTPTNTPTPNPWVTIGQYKAECNTEITFDPVTVRKLRFQVLSGGGDDKQISFYCCTSMGAGWLINGVWIPVNNPSLTLKVGDIRDTDEFTPTIVSKMRFNVGCNDKETIDTRLSYLPVITPTLTVTATTTVTTTGSITATSTITATPVLTTTATPTATVTITTTATVTATQVVTATATVTPTRPASPRGAIAYHWNDNGIDRVRVINLENNSTTPLVEIGPIMDLAMSTNSAFGAWSPDNSKFAYISAGSPGASNVLRVLDFKNNSTRSLYSSDAGGGLSSPTWSPDGTKIAFVRVSGNQRLWAIDVVNADGGRCGNKAECEITTNTQGEQFRGGLAWSKQGLYALAINSTGPSDIHTMFSDGNGRTNLTNNKSADDSTPTWSPDGKLIAFTSTRDGRPQIYVMNPDGGGMRRVSQSDFGDVSPTWSPDGNWIAFASMREGGMNIYMMDLQGGNVTQLTKGGGDHPIWSH